MRSIEFTPITQRSRAERAIFFVWGPNMNRNYKRALAVAAVAPLALIAGVGSAGAAVVTPTTTTTGLVTTITCTHPDYPAGGLALKLVETALGAAGTPGANDFSGFTVTATDDSGTAPFKTAAPLTSASLSSIKLEAFRDLDSHQINANPQATY